MTRKFPRSFTEGELMEGCRRTIENVRGLLHSSSVLLDNQDSQQHALGIYIYAVEEFGKAILLRSYITGNKRKYQIPGWILGRGNPSISSIAEDIILFKFLNQILGYPKVKPDDYIYSHTAKLLVGSNHLPPECSFIARGVKLSTPLLAGKVLNLVKSSYLNSEGYYRLISGHNRYSLRSQDEDISRNSPKDIVFLYGF
jgi:hypothetical protein